MRSYNMGASYFRYAFVMATEGVTDWICAHTGWRGALRGAALFIIPRGVVILGRDASVQMQGLLGLASIAIAVFLGICFFRAARRKGREPFFWCLAPVLLAQILMPTFCSLKPLPTPTKDPL